MHTTNNFAHEKDTYDGCGLHNCYCNVQLLGLLVELLKLEQALVGLVKDNLYAVALEYMAY